MFSPSSALNLLVASAFLCLFHHPSTAIFCTSSCGNFTVYHPFRLKTDLCLCGNKRYELACQDNALLLYFQASWPRKTVGFPVQAINYNNLTIRVAYPTVHMDNCALQPFDIEEHFDWYHFSNYRVPTDSIYMFIFVSCPYPMNGSLEVFSSPFNLKRYWYLRVQNHTDYIYSNDLRGSELENGCRIEGKYFTSLLPGGGAKNISYIDVINSLAYGFDLQWFRNWNMFLGYVFNYVLVILLVILIYSRVLSCLLGSICVTIFLIYKWRRRHLSAYDNVEEFLQSYHNYLMPIRYSYSEIKKISKGFKEKLGEGGYGSVYRGKLRSGSFVAIKMLNKSKANGEDFINEMSTIGRIHHANVVRLIGFCVEGSKRALVYEFMTNGSLDKHIFFKEGCMSMCNKMIYDICLGVANGIQYLHQGCDMQILHFDIKPHNILLDENFIPKISDFGLAKLHSTDHNIVSLTAARGTMGYIAPEFFYKNIGGISYKADIYSFGMLLMEMVGRRKNINAFTEHSSRIYFPSWIYDQFNEGKDIKLGDFTEEESNIVKKMLIVALWCIQLNPMDRPSMLKVIKMLEGKVEHLKMPPKPFAAPEETPINDAGLHTNLEVSPVDASIDYGDAIGLLIH